MPELNEPLYRLPKQWRLPKTRSSDLEESVISYGIYYGIYVLCVLPGIATPFYTSFVVQILWNWFVVEALHAPNISYFHALGLLIVIHVLKYTESVSKHADDDKHWHRVEAMIDACVPQQRRDATNAEIIAVDKQSEPTWLIALSIFEKPIVNTLALGAGFLVHEFLI